MKNILCIVLGLFTFICLFIGASRGNTHDPVKIGVVGLSHSHVLLLLRNLDRTDVQVVGITEPDKTLSARYASQYKIDENLFFDSLAELLEIANPEAVVVFTPINDHLKVVETCAPRGVHVMVEKPLAVSVEQAEKMIALSKQAGTLLLTNYETSWYPSNYEGYEMIEQGQLGDLRKIIFYHGHNGPREIGVNDEFLDWLTDPVRNGGGAVTDFGCYGADLITWMLKGQRPVSVYANLKQYKPGVYSNVDDDATIVLSYPTLEGVIHASWNWPFSRKEMHVYGSTGYALIDHKKSIRYRLDKRFREQVITVPPSKAPFADSFAFLIGAIRGDTKVETTDPSSPEVNLTVMEILEAAKESSRTGKQIFLEKKGVNSRQSKASVL